MLLLKKHLVALVRAGKKRQTIRLWTRANLRAGQISYTPGLGRMKITAVDQLASLRDLTEADAKADGFDSLAELLAEIRRIYGKVIPKDRKVFRIQFDWPIDKPAPAPAVPARAGVSRVSKLPGISQINRPAVTKPAAGKTAKGNRSRAMTAGQRKTLQSFILSRAPSGGARHGK
jgi:hypothetical protein